MSCNVDFFSVNASAHCWNFQWNLKNFSQRRETIYSDEINFEGKCPLKWKLMIEFPLATHCSQFQYMRVGLEILNSKIYTVDGTLSFNITNGNGKLYVSKSKKFSFSNSNHVCKCDSIAKPSNHRYILGNKNEEFILNDDRLIMNGMIIVEECCLQRTLIDVSPSDNIKQLQLDFKNLWKNSEFVDVDVKIKNEVIRAHKFVLCARSPVFNKMFQNDMKEKACSSVKITDMEKSVVETFLTFLYTGVMEDRKFETVMALYSAADKYEVLTLQKTCRDILVSFITHSTVSVIMKLADTHHDDSLKNTAVKYICDNFSEVESTSDWNKLLDSDPRLASFALKQVSLKAAKE